LVARDDRTAKGANNVDVLLGRPVLELADEIGGADRAIALRERSHRLERPFHVNAGAVMKVGQGQAKIQRILRSRRSRRAGAA
ncbi:MAG: hypothetical protein ABIQ52_17240, partial [Vicinamibacterales bacterium]